MLKKDYVAIPCTVSPEVAKELKNRADKEDRTVTAVLRRMINKELKRDLNRPSSRV